MVTKGSAIHSPGDGGECCAHWVGQISAFGMRMHVKLDHLRPIAKETTPEEHVRKVDVEHIDEKV